jgi:hemolysin type calcium-binding protein
MLSLSRKERERYSLSDMCAIREHVAIRNENRAEAWFQMRYISWWTTVSPKAGDDYVHARANNDRLYGKNGNDTLDPIQSYRWACTLLGVI